MRRARFHVRLQPMPTVFIPAMMQKLTEGQGSVELDGANVRELVNNLDKRYPGCRDWLVDGTELKPNISVAIDGAITPMGLLEEVDPDSEVHFVAALAGGADSAAVPR